MRKFITGAAIAALVSTPLFAQTAPVQTAAVEVPVQSAALEAAMLTLPANSPITLVVAKEVNSSTNDAGELISLTVLNDVKIGDTVVIPRGTPAAAEITWRTGKGAFGKSGKLEFAMRYIDLGGQHIPITGEYRQEGEGNTIATGVGIIAVGVFAGFITGKRARVPMGRELMSALAQPVSFTADGRLDPSFDGAAAMAAAEAKTPLGQCRAAAAALPAKKQKKATEACFSKRME
jgi:hypothetical protein